MSDSPRRGRHTVSVAELRREGQPEHIRTREGAEHWSAAVLWRRVSPFVSVVAIRLGLSANAVTGFMIAVGWLAAASLALGNLWGAALAVLLAHVQMILDAADGEVARWRRTCSPRGIFLDRVAHTTTEALMPIGLGVGLARAYAEDSWMWIAAGLGLGVMVLVNKSVNDGVAIARAASGLASLPHTAAARSPRPGAIARARNAARWLPLHRLYHSVEQSHLYLVAYLAAVAVPSAPGWVLVSLLVITPVVIIGHIAAAMASPRLTP
jgi:phosphatidylglycerophosphate synthase